jgi:hypothetical protein
MNLLRTELEQTSEEYLRFVRDQAERDGAVEAVLVLLGSSVTLDRLSMSMLVVTGAMLTLCISQAQSLTAVFTMPTYKAMLGLFLVSSLMGYLEKAMHSLASIYIGFYRELRAGMKKVLSEYEDIRRDVVRDAREVETTLETIVLRPDSMIELVVRAFPEAWQSYIRASMCAKTVDQGNSIFIFEALKYEVWQVLAFFAQAMFLVVGILVVLFGGVG